MRRASGKEEEERKRCGVVGAHTHCVQTKKKILFHTEHNMLLHFKALSQHLRPKAENE